MMNNPVPDSPYRAPQYNMRISVPPQLNVSQQAYERPDDNMSELSSESARQNENNQ
jgi:hypothetical protein